MATRMMQRNNLADAFVLVNDEQTNAALKAAREKIGDAEWKKGYTPENKVIVRDALKEHGARYETKLTGILVGVEEKETRIGTKAWVRLLDAGGNDQILSLDKYGSDKDLYRNLVPALKTVADKHPGEEVTINVRAKQVERDGNQYVNHEPAVRDAQNQIIPSETGHFKEAKAEGLEKQAALRAAGVGGNLLAGVQESVLNEHFDKVFNDVATILKEKGIAPKAVESERGPFPALESGIKDRDGIWHNLSLYEKDGQLTGTLQRRGAQPGEYEKASVVFEPDGKGGLAAEAAYDHGEKLAVRLSRSEPTQGGFEKVDVRILSRDGQIHEYPGRLRANKALQNLPDHREGKVIEQALGVDPKMLNPGPPREVQKAPAKTQEKQQAQGVQL